MKKDRPWLSPKKMGTLYIFHPGDDLTCRFHYSTSILSPPGASGCGAALKRDMAAKPAGSRHGQRQAPLTVLGQCLPALDGPHQGAA